MSHIRRSKIFSAMLIIISIIIILAGCFDNQPNSDVTTSSIEQPSSTDKLTEVRDLLRVALTSEPPSIGIYDHSSLISVQMNSLTFNGLMAIDHVTLEPICDLAKDYLVENDVEWTFNLNEGVKFHNGEPMTSEDVVASINYAKSLPATALYTGAIKEVIAISPNTVKIITNEPYAGLLYDLAYYYNYIVPKSLIDSGNDFNQNPIGTGPYRLAEWSFGNFISYEAFHDYFDVKNRASIEKLVFNIIPEGSSRSIALEAGEIDFVWEVSGADVRNLQSNDKIKVVEIDSVDNVILFFNNDIDPWSDKNLRNAIAAAINRQDIIDAALNGFGMPNYSAIAMGHAGSSDKDAIVYDLKMAKEYLSEWGGDPNKVKLSILCSNETRVAIGTVIQSNLAEIGIEVDVVGIDTAAYMARWRAGDFDSVIASWSPSNALSYIQRFHSDRRNTYAGGINDSSIDLKVKRAAATLDETDRMALIEDIIALINQTSPQISLYQSQWFRAHDSNLSGVICSKTGYALFNKMYWTQ